MKAKIVTRNELAKVFRLNADGKLERLWERWGKHKWRLVRNVSNHKKGYCQVKLQSGTRLMYHRVVWILTHGDILDSSLEIHHIDEDKLNNDISNLTLVSSLVNNQEAVKQRTGKLGYYWNKVGKLWVTQIRINGRGVHIGNYALEQQASNAYKIACSLVEMYDNDNKSFRSLVNGVLTGELEESLTYIVNI
jgi:hypothetical protein